MIIRQLDATGDWQFGKGLANYAYNQQAVEENIQTRIKSWVGDCFFALDEGVDWKSRLDVGQKINLQNELKAIILQSYGVVSVDSVVVVFGGDTRLFTLTYVIDTIFSSNVQQTLQQSLGG